MFHVKNVLKQGDALTPLLFNFKICHLEGAGKPGGLEIRPE